MKNILKTEEIGMMLAPLVLIPFLGISLPWWIYPILFFAPDLGILGYLGGNKTGAVVYNLFHHKGLATAIGITGWLLQDNYLLLAGLILFSHASFDRVFGFGLKYTEGFKHTHLGMMK